ncbi:hypothetical protein BD413DRAFT_544431 [Trametes elegans]|nr:hypothetical protein BD413DRAFT_544431 [Trametes elegans]
MPTRTNSSKYVSDPAAGGVDPDTPLPSPRYARRSTSPPTKRFPSPRRATHVPREPRTASPPPASCFHLIRVFSDYLLHNRGMACLRRHSTQVPPPTRFCLDASTVLARATIDAHFELSRGQHKRGAA